MNTETPRCDVYYLCWEKLAWVLHFLNQATALYNVINTFRQTPVVNHSWMHTLTSTLASNHMHLTYFLENKIIKHTMFNQIYGNNYNWWSKKTEKKYCQLNHNRPVMVECISISEMLKCEKLRTLELMKNNTAKKKCIDLYGPWESRM